MRFLSCETLWCTENLIQLMANYHLYNYVTSGDIGYRCEPPQKCDRNSGDAKKTKTSRDANSLSHRERHAMKVLLGDPLSTDFSPPALDRHHSDSTAVTRKESKRSLKRQTSLSGTRAPKSAPLMTSSSHNAEETPRPTAQAVHSRTITSTESVTPQPVDAACCVIL